MLQACTVTAQRQRGGWAGHTAAGSPGAAHVRCVRCANDLTYANLKTNENVTLVRKHTMYTRTERPIALEIMR